MFFYIKQNLKVVFLFTLFGGVIFALISHYISRTFAAGTAVITLDPTGQISGTHQDIQIKIDSGSQKVGFVRASITFDPDKFQVSDNIVISSPFETIIQKTESSAANTTGEILLVSALPPGQIDNAPSGLFTFATIPLDVRSSKVNDPTEIRVDVEDTQIVDLENSGLQIESLVSTYTLNYFATPTPTLVPTQTPTIAPSVSQLTPTFAPSNAPVLTNTPTPTVTEPSIIPTGELSLVGPDTVQIGDTLSFDLTLRTNTLVSGVDAVLSYDPEMITIESFTDYKLLSDNTLATIDNVSGIVRLSQVKSEGFQGEGRIATIYARPKKVGNSSISFVFINGQKSESNVIDRKTGEDILIKPDSYDFLVPQERYVQVQLQTLSEDTSLGFRTEGSVTDTNNWVSTFLTSVEGISEKILLPNISWSTNSSSFEVKVPGYLKKKITVVLNPGDTILNFGQLVAGDINDDGIINIVDVSLMYDSWFGNGVADYNKDSIVNSADFWILTQNLLLTEE